MFDLVNGQLWLAFVAASAVLAIMPGPIVAMLIANSLSYGARTGIRNMGGVVSGNIVLFAIGGFGLAWVLELLSHGFDVIRWLGAAYLIYLGFQQWRAAPESLENPDLKRKPGRSMFWQGFLVAITNPKTIVFYAAFFPQFLDPALPSTDQLIVLTITFLIVVNGIDLIYVLLADRMRPLLAGEKRGRLRNRITGGLLMGTGIAMALARR